MNRQAHLIGRSCFCLLAVFLCAGGAMAIINPQVTPVHVVRAARTVLWGRAVAVGDGGARFEVVEALHGKADCEAMGLDLSRCRTEERAGVHGLLRTGGGDGALLFISAREPAKAMLHVSGTWLSLRSDARERWSIEGVAAPMSAVYAGGTDMLARMARYILADPAATVPVCAGVGWMADVAELGHVAGEIAGMEVIRLPDDSRCYLYVASSGGDRLFRSKEGAESFDDVTARFGIDGCSRHFAWTCLTPSGRPSLVAWDGTAIAVWTIDAGGRFRRDGPALEWKQPCLGLAGCSAPDVAPPAILISTVDVPVLVWRDAQGRWTRAALPDGEVLRTLGAATSACVVADLDNDGRFDVLQSRAAGGALWTGRAGGFAGPAKCAVACADGPARTALGDFDQDGFLDLFLAGKGGNELWENDGRGRFRAVAKNAGTLGYKCVAGLSGCRVADLNHDGRQDLCLLNPRGAFTYHFNRGFRCFGEEGELRLPGAEGQVACAVEDFNADGSLDLAVAFADGTVRCYFNDSFNKPLLRVRLPPAAAWPVTVSIWQGSRLPVCMGTVSVGGPVRAIFALGNGREYTLRWTEPRKGAHSRSARPPDTSTADLAEITLDE